VITTNKTVKTIAITTWGNPWKTYSSINPSYRWEEVEYILKTKNEVRMKSRTTLPLLQKTYEFDEVVVLVQESILFNEVDDYENLKENIRKVFKEFIKELEEKSQVTLNNVEIYVTPAVGNFKNSLEAEGGLKYLDLEICGSITDYYSMTYYIIAKELLNHVEELAVSDDGKLHIVLDLTHGINYTPTLTYEAVKRVAGLLAWFTPVKLTVLNSEPVTHHPHAGGYYIHVVEDGDAPNTVEIYGLHEGKPLTVNDRCVESLGSEEVGKEVSNKLRKLGLIKKDLNAFLGSFTNGIPLSAVVLQPDPTKLQKALEEIVRLYEGFTNVIKFNESKVNVLHKVRFKGDFMGVVSAWVLSKMLRSIGFQSKEYLTLNELKELSSKVFNKNEKFKALISRDIYELKERLKNVVGFKTLSQVFEGKVEECVEELTKQDKFRRNFLAHSGFERCVTIVEACEEDFKISYAYLMKPLSEVDRELAGELVSKLSRGDKAGGRGISNDVVKSYILNLIKDALSVGLIYMQI